MGFLVFGARKAIALKLEDSIGEDFGAMPSISSNQPAAGRSEVGTGDRPAKVLAHLTLEEYLRYDDGTDTRYELVSGELAAMPPESPQNVSIALFLMMQFLRFFPVNQVSNKAEIVVAGSRTTTRLPDVTVFGEALAIVLQTATRSTVLPDMPPPLLVVEVVSPGKTNRDRDYRYKRSEYAARGIQEYWIVDAETAQVTVLSLVEGLYEESQYPASAVVASQILPDLKLTVKTILNAGLS